MAFLQRQMNRGSVSTGFNIDNSCVFVDTDRSSTGNGAILICILPHQAQAIEKLEHLVHG